MTRNMSSGVRVTWENRSPSGVLLLRVVNTNRGELERGKAARVEIWAICLTLSRLMLDKGDQSP